MAPRKDPPSSAVTCVSSATTPAQLQSKLGAKVYTDLRACDALSHAAQSPGSGSASVLSLLKDAVEYFSANLAHILDNSFSTERPSHPEKITPAELEQMNSKIDEAITLLQKKVADQVKSDSVQASIAANFPPDAVTGATDAPAYEGRRARRISR